MGWICGVSVGNEPHLISVNLDSLDPIDEYPLTTSLGLAQVDDCAISSVTIDVEHLEYLDESSSEIVIRQAQVVVVAFRSNDVIKWGVVEAY